MVDMRVARLLAASSLVTSLGLAALACSSGSSSEGTSGADAGTTAGALTFHEHVEKILQDRCQDCHHEGGIAPFSLVTYEDAKRWGPLLVDVTQSGAMPPWGAYETDECKPRHGFKDDLRMKAGEIDALKTWVDGGSQKGDPSKAPPPRTFAKAGLSGTTEDLAIPSYDVAPASKDELRCFVLDPKLTEDTWIDGTDIVPGDPTVVHHALVFSDPKGESRAKAGAAGSYECFGGSGVAGANLLVAWAPGVPPSDYGKGVGTLITKGSLLIMQIHYHPGAETRSDATKLVLRRALTKPEWAATVRLIGNFGNAPALLPGPNDAKGTPEFLIPAGAKEHTESMEFTIPAAIPEVKLAGVGTHMHWVGKDMKVEIERATERPGQPTNECLLQTPKYDFNWQRGYTYDASIDALPTLAGGDKLKMRCTYDNSMDNPLVAKALSEMKLSSPVDVHLGEETLDEMCLGAFTFLTKVP